MTLLVDTHVLTEMQDQWLAFRLLVLTCLVIEHRRLQRQDWVEWDAALTQTCEEVKRRGDFLQFAQRAIHE